jgi:hypothetical protein
MVHYILHRRCHVVVASKTHISHPKIVWVFEPFLLRYFLDFVFLANRYDLKPYPFSLTLGTKKSNTFILSPCWIYPKPFPASFASGQVWCFLAHPPLAGFLCWYAHPRSVNTCQLIFHILAFWLASIGRTLHIFPVLL